VTERIFAVLYVSIMGLTRCYKTTVLYVHLSVTIGRIRTHAIRCRSATFAMRPNNRAIPAMYTKRSNYSGISSGV